MAQLEHIEAIEKRLWGAADTLRRNSNYAVDAGGQVVFLNEFVRGDSSLADLVRARISLRDDTTSQ